MNTNTRRRSCRAALATSLGDLNTGLTISAFLAHLGCTPAFITAHKSSFGKTAARIARATGTAARAGWSYINGKWRTVRCYPDTTILDQAVDAYIDYLETA